MMQEIRFHGDERLDDRLTPQATTEDIERALSDKLTRKVLLHKPGARFYLRVDGERRRFKVLPDGRAIECPKRVSGTSTR
jgi:hypothetical protein